MGWTTCASNGRDTISLLKSSVIGENEHVKLEWLDHAQRGAVVYAVIKRTHKQEDKDTTYVHEADGSYRFIAVFLTRRNHRDAYDFGYNSQSEEMGPADKDCPKRLLDLASPFRDDYNGYGREWRAACLARNAEHRGLKANAPKPGQTFRTLKPVKFRDGNEHSVFTCIQVKQRGRKATLYRAKGSGTLYRFRPATFGFEIISAPTNSKETVQ